MLAYPETHSCAQAELDTVVGRARPTSFADYPNLPYIHAMVKEALRWRPVAPLAGPHRCTKDDWYEGTFIPEGTICLPCLPNLWYMNCDPEIFAENATQFDLAWHLNVNGDIAHGPSNTKEEHISYGFGRRKCVSQHVANNLLFIDIAVLLWATKIERKKDASGQLIPLDLDGFEGHGLTV